MNDEKHRRDAEHLWHVWLNRWNEGREFDHSMYEFKSMVDFLRYGWRLLERAFTGNLPKTHQQCSHSSPVEIKENRLRCSFGKDVTECEILLSLKKSFEESRTGYYAEIPDAELFKIMGNTCAWHLYTEPLKTGQFLDTTEGWLMDVSDRMFWDNVYKSLSYSDESENPPLD